MAARRRLPFYSISALKGEGLRALVEAIARRLGGEGGGGPDA
jgi:hypothetical protein